MAKNFVLFTKRERKNIWDNYVDIVTGNKNCMDYPWKKVYNALKGMYIYPVTIPKEKGKKELCAQIIESYKNDKFPIVHEDSLTAWQNQAAEQYGLEIRDILKMKPGQKMKVILMDRNVGDYMHGTKVNTKYDPRKKGFSYATYTHKDGLCGKLEFDMGVIHEDFMWEINRDALKQKKYKIFWGPVPNSLSIKKLNPKIKVGWRGPAIDIKDTKYLPKKVVHYDTWWDDYGPNRIHNYLNVKRRKR